MHALHQSSYARQVKGWRFRARRSVDLSAFDFDIVAIIQVIPVAQLHVGRNLDNRVGMMASALFVGIGSQDEGPPSEDRTRDQIHGDVSTIFFTFEPKDIFGRGVGICEGDIECAREQIHTGLAQIMVVQFIDPKGEVADSGDDFSAQDQRYQPPVD